MTVQAPLALRMDDVGASSKRYEVYSKKRWHLGPVAISGNWLFLKYLPGIRAWGPYRELRSDEWHAIFDLLQTYAACLTVAVTAAWAVRENRLIPFPERFPRQAAALKEGIQSGLIEIANHGLTHCVLQGNAFRPKWRHANRRAHREFWDWLPAEVHHDHIRRAQAILQDTFGVEVVTFVPPGNVFAEATLQAAREHGLRVLSCQAEPGARHGMLVVGNENVLPFHDRDIVLHGIGWLGQQLEANRGRRFCFVRDLAGEGV